MMQEDDAATTKQESPATKSPATRTGNQWFTTPKPIKRLFDKFPLQTLPANELPVRTAQNRDQHTLYIFTTEQAARHGEPSFNPSCLKWQVCCLPPQPGSMILVRVATPANTQNGTGLPQIPQPPLHHRPLHQPRISHRLPPIPPPPIHLILPN